MPMPWDWPESRLLVQTTDPILVDRLTQEEFFQRYVDQWGRIPNIYNITTLDAESWDILAEMPNAILFEQE